MGIRLGYWPNLWQGTLRISKCTQERKTIVTMELCWEKGWCLSSWKVSGTKATMSIVISFTPALQYVWSWKKRILASCCGTVQINHKDIPLSFQQKKVKKGKNHIQRWNNNRCEVGGQSEQWQLKVLSILGRCPQLQEVEECQEKWKPSRNQQWSTNTTSLWAAWTSQISW